MKKYRVGIVGCGNIYEMHANAIEKLDITELVAVCDLKSERVKAAGERYGANIYEDYREMIAKEQLDVIHICLPHHLHEEVTIEAVRNGLHVLTEKPMAITVSAAERMIKEAGKANVYLGVIFQNRYNKGAQTLKELISSGELGKVLAGKCQVTWSRDDTYYSQSDWKGTWEKEGGGVIIDQAIHTLDLVNWLVAGKPKSIDATIRNRGHEKIEVEDFAEGIIKYEEDFIISFMATNYYSFDAPVSIELHLEAGIVTITGARLEINFFDGRSPLVVDIPESDYIENGIASKTYWGTGHIVQIEEFYQQLSGEKSFLVSGDEALKTQKIVAAIYQSAKLNQTVTL